MSIDRKAQAAAVLRGEIPLPPGCVDWAASIPEAGNLSRSKIEKNVREVFANLVTEGYITWGPRNKLMTKNNLEPIKLIRTLHIALASLEEFPSLHLFPVAFDNKAQPL